MGWTGYFPNKQAAIAEEFERCVILKQAHAESGDEWVLLEHHGQRFIALCLFERHAGGYMVKVVDESMGPLQYDVPIAWLDLAPVAERYGAEWRQKVYKSRGVNVPLSRIAGLRHVNQAELAL